MNPKNWKIGILALLLFLSGNAHAGQGDVYILQDIRFPELFKGSAIDVNVTVENKNFNPSTDNATLYISIRTDQGDYVSGFSPSIPIIFSPATTTQSKLVRIEDAGALTLTAGETYTLFAYIEGAEGNDDINANNYGIKTFTVVNPVNPISVPDAPEWAPMLLASIVLGLLYIGSRKEKGEK